MRACAEAWPDESIVQQLVAQIPWGHKVRLLGNVKNSREREWYIHKTIGNGWTRNVLVHWIESDLIGVKATARTNFERTLPPPQSDLARQSSR
jgi:predicted nuclease of restriction endonuclease-like (RecB) superfamily